MSSSITTDPDYDIPVVGTITALNGVVELDPLQKDQQAVNIAGTWSATLVFEASTDGSAWFSISAYNVANGALVSSTTANGTFLLITAGYTNTRVRASAFTSGTVNVSNEGTEDASVMYAVQPNSNSFRGTVKLVGSDSAGTSETYPVEVSQVPENSASRP